MVKKTIKKNKVMQVIAIVLGVICIAFSCIAFYSNTSSTINTKDTPETYNETFDADASLYSAGNSLYDPTEYIKSRYDVVSITESVSYMLSGWSYSSQSSLNYYYNKYNSASVNGTCGVVACTSIAYYCATQKGYSDIPANKNTIFAKLIGYYGITGSEGTSSSTYKKAIPWLFSEYGYSISASRSTALYKYTKMREKAEAGIPTEFSTSGTDLYGSHAMVVVGYKKYTISYTSGNTIKTTTETYYALDEGWGRNKPAYVFEGSMPGSWEITTISI